MMMRQRIHDILEKQIAMEGGARRKKRAPRGKMILNKKGKWVSYAKHMQGKRLAREYGFAKGSKTAKRRPRRKMRGGGFEDDYYGYGYDPDYYSFDPKTQTGGPKKDYQYMWCKDNILGPKPEGEQKAPIFYNPRTGKCEKALYGQELLDAMDEYAYKEAKKQVHNPLSKTKLKELTAYNTLLSELYKGESVRAGPRSFAHAVEEGPDEITALTEALSKVLKKKKK